MKAIRPHRHYLHRRSAAASTLDGSPQVDPKIFSLGIPVLGICYGCQLMAHYLGGKVTAAQDDTAREYGKTETFFDTDCQLFKGLPEESVSWMSHGDYMAKVPEGFASGRALPTPAPTSASATRRAASTACSSTRR